MEIIFIVTSLAVLIYFLIKKGDRCPNCGNKMRNYGDVGDGKGPANDYKLFICTRCYKTQEKYLG